MGLDIYLKKVKRTRKNSKVLDGEDWEQIENVCEEQYRNELKKTFNKTIKVLEATDSDAYAKEYEKQIKKLCKLINYPQYDLDVLGVGYDYDKREFTYTPVPVETFKEHMDRIVARYYGFHFGYFRKVNFFYAYFSNRDRLVDEKAWMTKDDAQDILNRCEAVLKQHGLASTLLPTQSGFFFGSTEYDKMYYEDVKDCAKQMKTALKILDKKDNQVFVIMSW